VNTYRTNGWRLTFGALVIGSVGMLVGLYIDQAGTPDTSAAARTFAAFILGGIFIASSRFTIGENAVQPERRYACELNSIFFAIGVLVTSDTIMLRHVWWGITLTWVPYLLELTYDMADRRLRRSNRWGTIRKIEDLFDGFMLACVSCSVIAIIATLGNLAIQSPGWIVIPAGILGFLAFVFGLFAKYPEVLDYPFATGASFAIVSAAVAGSLFVSWPIAVAGFAYGAIVILIFHAANKLPRLHETD